MRLLILQKEEKVYDVEEIDRRKKLMEQQNTNKKQLLTQALAHQRNKTRQQSARLRQIEAELKHLDVALALDVKRVRQRVSCLLGLLRSVVGNLLLHYLLFSHILLLSVVRRTRAGSCAHAYMCVWGVRPPLSEQVFHSQRFVGFWMCRAGP
jgi:hypothetical protein